MKKKVAILYGGRSVEHGVSINSARNIYQHICKDTFEVFLIGITPEGKWFKTEEVHKQIDQGTPLKLSLDPGEPYFIEDNGNKWQVDIAFPVLHGTDGEDGCIQGLFNAMGLPIVGTGVLGSSIAMNKAISKQLFSLAGLEVAPYESYIQGRSAQPNFEDLAKKLGTPFMVKSASLGSSVGISKVSTEAEFKEALTDSLKYDHCVLFETYIKGREIECAVIGNATPTASIPGEIILSPRCAFYTFDAKYVDGDAVSIEIPASIPEETVKTIQEQSLKAFQALHCEDFARVDLFLTPDGKILINEINTIPGFTNSSMFPMMWDAMGVSYQELITRLINLANDRHQSLTVSRQFSSSLNY